MNLGDIFLKAFFCITATGLVAAMVVSVGFCRWRRLSVGWAVAMSLVLGLVFTFIGNSLFHERIFTMWQQSQNTWVPQNGCLTYKPSFGRLYATYSMDRVEFQEWVATYPVALEPHDASDEAHDAERLGFGEPELAYATEMAPNGKQLRVYFEGGVMFLSYNVM